MKFLSLTARWSLIFVLLAGCGDQAAGQTVETLEPLQTKPTVWAPGLADTAAIGGTLFLETSSVVQVPEQAHVVRSRFVKLNLALLLDVTGQPVLPAGTMIIINLFPDVIYTGIITETSEAGGAFTWNGYLKEVKSGKFTMLYTGGTFIAQFSSLAGIYEVSNVGGDLYQVIQIDQRKLPGTEG